MTLDEVVDVWRYDPESGGLFWLIGRFNGTRFSNARIGREAGCVSRDGYRMVQHDGVLRLSHRVAWVLMTGSEAPQHIDHINGKKDDNRWANLRSVTRSENLQNRQSVSKNRAGLLGVGYHTKARAGKHWSAEIRTDGNRRHLGYFSTPQEAHLVYLEAKRRLHRTCTI